MDERSEPIFTDRYRVSAPRVRAACHALAHRYGLRWQDRLDLEQELWLALIVEWHRRDDAGISESDGTDLLLPNEMDWLWGRWLSGATDNKSDIADDRPPLLAGALPCPQLATSDDKTADIIRRIDLRLDIAELLGRLSAEDRSHCQQLIAVVSIATDDPLAELHPLETPASSCPTSRLRGARLP